MIWAGLKSCNMAKRAKYLAVFLLLPIMLLCGCSSGEKRLSPEEYKTAIESSWNRYLNSLLDLIELSPLEINEAALKELSENAEKAQPALKMREQSLKEFAEIVPPEKYEELHKRLIAAIDAWEYEQLELHRKMFEAKTVAELEEISRKISEHAQNTSDDTFPMVYILIAKELSADSVGVQSLQ